MQGHAVLGVDLPDGSRLGELCQSPVDLDQQCAVIGANSQGHVPVLAGDVLGDEPQRPPEPGVFVEVPGGEVRVQEGGVERCGRESIEQRFAARKPDQHVVLLGDGHRAGHDPDPPAAEIGQRADRGRVAWDHQAELGTRVGDAPGHRAGRAGIERLAEHHVAAALGQAVPGALGTGTPVELDRPAQAAAQPLGHGDIQPPGRPIRRFPGPRHRRRHCADDERLRPIVTAHSRRGQGHADEQRQTEPERRRHGRPRKLKPSIERGLHGFPSIDNDRFSSSHHLSIRVL